MKLFKDISSGNMTSKNELPLLPLRELVIFPGAYRNIYVGRKESIDAVESSIKNFNNYIFLGTQKSSSIEHPSLHDIHEVGIIAKIIEVNPTPDKNLLKVLIEGLYRAKALEIESFENHKTITCEKLKTEKLANPAKTETLLNIIVNDFKKYANLARIPQETLKNISRSKSEESLVNSIMPHLKTEMEKQVQILEEPNPEKRLSMLAEIIYANIESIQLEKKISHEVRKKIEKSQKDFFLHEQIKEIQKELGQLPEDNEIYNLEDFEKKLDSLGMPEQAKAKALLEQKRLIKLPQMSPESGILRNYIDWLLELPWKAQTEDSADLNYSKEILDKEHYSLKKAKNRILEFLAVRQLNPMTKGPILCFVGPPGTGKTSLAKSVAHAIGREFIRISLGGVRDEAEIRGHRRTYLGAMPGKIIQSMRKVGTTNPVFLLDEIDKMSSDFRGDPASALLEVLDPEQNNQFIDHYLDVAYNLSEVMFIATANSLRGIPYPLLDRMEVIYISSYTELEKVRITRDFLIPREKKENGIEKLDLRISQRIISEIIRSYTMEAGVRSLQRQIASICRKAAKYIVMKKKEIDHITVNSNNLAKFLGKKKFIQAKDDKALDIGVSHGLAWSELGGSLLPIEIVLYPGTGKIILTGKLGDVMKESAQTAFSYIRANAHNFNIQYKDFYKEYDVHIHFPEGAIPKDGPSGGIAITCGILSALTKTPLKSSVAMTGEITLTGKILAIGGLKEKSLAALRHNKENLLLPKDNDKNIDELPGVVKKKIKFHLLSRAEDAFKVVFTKSVYKKKRASRKKEKPEAAADSEQSN